jgi:hypothetical protein
MSDSWDDAPNWARYRTKDSDGAVWYWEHRPVRRESMWMPTSGRNCPAIAIGWTLSLEVRDG